MWMPHAAHCACRHPDAHGHRPVTRQPPSTGMASPCGASEPATHASGFAPHTSRCARSGKSAASQAQTLIRLATHAVDAAAAADLRDHLDVGANARSGSRRNAAAPSAGTARRPATPARCHRPAGARASVSSALASRIGRIAAARSISVGEVGGVGIGSAPQCFLTAPDCAIRCRLAARRRTAAWI